MTIPLADRDGTLLSDAAAAVLEAAERADAVVVGPGLGRADESFELARLLLSELDRPLLVDADGLNAIAGAGLGTVSKRSAPTVLTPHAGELARLLDTESRQVSAKRLESVRAAAAQAGCVVILKGDDSLIAEGNRIAVSAGGSPALATAGTGDVLSGVVAAFLAQGLGGFESACAGVYAHAQAGWLAATQYGAESVIATDVIDALPGALRRPEGEPLG
jgi:NAD(P)H-hydrate epimerase